MISAAEPGTGCPKLLNAPLKSAPQITQWDSEPVKTCSSNTPPFVLIGITISLRFLVFINILGTRDHKKSASKGAFLPGIKNYAKL
jgi:hypothetical protein